MQEKIESFINDYLKIKKAESIKGFGHNIDIDNSWNKLWNDYSTEFNKTEEYFMEKFSKILKPNQILDFHDAYVTANVKPEKNNQFSIELYLMCYEKEPNDKNKLNYQSVEGKYVKFFINDSLRNSFRKLGNKSSTILKVMVMDNNIGFVYIDKNDHKFKGLIIKNFDIERIEEISYENKIKNNPKFKF